MEYRVIIEVDTNDGDYLETAKLITEEQLPVIDIVAQAIKKFEPYQGKEIVPEHNYECTHNFITGELVRQDMGELSAREYYVEKHGLLTAEQYQTFMELCPYAEYGFHTVSAIEIMEIQSHRKLFP